MENWKPVVGYEGYYEISDLGRVRSVDREVISYKGHTIRFVGRIKQAALDKGGYPRYCLSKNRKMKSKRGHAMVLAAFVGPRPKGYLIRHLDGNPSNNVLENLTYGTYLENSADMIVHGTQTWGEKHHCAKLSEEDIVTIKNMKKEGMSGEEVAKVFNVTRQHINMIASGKVRTRQT